jgi:peptidoglycan/LPS O-acetylase OafA/YrhL
VSTPGRSHLELQTADGSQPELRPPIGRRIAKLDGLRSLVILVLLVHFTDSVAFDAAGQRIVLGLQTTALIALDVFFVLSGFLITGILLDTKNGPDYFRNFFLRRLLRIFPLYYGFLVLYFVVLPTVSDRFEPLEPAQHLYYWGYLINVAKAFDWEIARSTGHLWSLAVEEQFYLVWPVVVYACSTAGLRGVCIACLVLSPIARVFIAHALPDTTAYHQLVRLDVLALGGLVALIVRSSDGTHGVRRWMFGGAAAAVTAAGMSFAFASSQTAAAMFSSASAYLAGAFFLVTLQSPDVSLWSRLVGSWPLRQIGTYSYAIYVLHDPLADSLARFGIVNMPQRGVREAVWYCAVMLPLCIAAGAVSWHAYEKQFVRFKGLFAYSGPIASKRPTAPGSPLGVVRRPDD